MIEKIFLEKEIEGLPRTNEILGQYPQAEVKIIDRFDQVFGRARKPYLQKRESLNLFLAKKRGDIVKPAPDAYGLAGEPHFYFVHSYNCIYECEYCYLQGYFDSPDLVFFLNHEEIGAEIQRTVKANSGVGRVWFHAGEFSDSLALSHLSGELPYLFSVFENLPEAILELRTKSANLREIKKLKPLKNVVVSFSLSPQMTAKTIDRKTPSIEIRLKAMHELAAMGFKFALHFDPMIWRPDFESAYQGLIQDIAKNISIQDVEYISVGVVRFTEDVYHEVAKNYPDSLLLKQEMQKSFDQKIRYPRPLRFSMMRILKNQLLGAGVSDEKIYFCMEN